MFFSVFYFIRLSDDSAIFDDEACQRLYTLFIHPNSPLYCPFTFLPSSLSFPVEETCNLFRSLYLFWYQCCMSMYVRVLERRKRHPRRNTIEIVRSFILLMTQSILCKPEKVYGL